MKTFHISPAHISIDDVCSIVENGTKIALSDESKNSYADAANISIPK